jgi:hypothetical protein
VTLFGYLIPVYLFGLLVDGLFRLATTYLMAGGRR